MTWLLFGGLWVWVWGRRGAAPHAAPRAVVAGCLTVAIAASSDGTASEPWHEVGVGAATGSWTDCGGVHRHVGGGAAYKAYLPVSDTVELTAAAQAGGGRLLAHPEGVFGEGVVLLGVEHRWVTAEIGGLGSTLDPALTPAARLRIGPRDVVWAVAAAFASRPYALPRPGAELGLGFALPRLVDAWDHPRVEGGVAGSGFYLKPSVPLPGRWTVEAFGAYGDRTTWQASAGVRYAFGPRPIRPTLPPWGRAD